MLSNELSSSDAFAEILNLVSLATSQPERKRATSMMRELFLCGNRGDIAVSPYSFDFKILRMARGAPLRHVWYRAHP